MKNLLFVSAALLVSLGAYAQEKKIDEKDVPAPVMAKFKAFNGDMTKAKWEMDGNKYEAEFKGADKKKMSITYSAEGNILEKEWEMKKGEMPKNVQDSLAKFFPGAKVNECEKLDKNGLVVYECELMMKDKDGKMKKWVVELTPEGKVWSKEEMMEPKKDEKKDVKKDDKKDEKKKDDKKDQK
ncbi:MAG TPA: hypothetical protein VI112_16000 [Bacteroidia bacterium]|jgi:hypothetical protein